TIIGGLLTINGAVFLLWQYASIDAEYPNNSGWLPFMKRHLLVSPDALREGRWHTLLTNVFSHSTIVHLSVNMILLHSIGTSLMQWIGPGRFLLLFAGAGSVSSLVASGYHAYLLPWLESYWDAPHRPYDGSLGASDILFLFILVPNIKYLVMFVVPVPAAVCIYALSAVDLVLAFTLNVSHTLSSSF
ncbi:hypothetical protein BDF14DRAFT_1685815, partial [Spinellus fusiger]